MQEKKVLTPKQTINCQEIENSIPGCKVEVTVYDQYVIQFERQEDAENLSKKLDANGVEEFVIESFMHPVSSENRSKNHTTTYDIILSPKDVAIVTDNSFVDKVTQRGRDSGHNK